MAAHVITIAQQKGGAGKTTLAAQLAVAWAKARRSVAVIDIDPQGSLSAWHALRTETLGEGSVGIHLSQVAGWRLSTELDRLRDTYDVVIVDSPPHAETEAKAAIRAADIVLLPVQPSPMDLWALEPTLEVARKEKTPALLVLNRMPPRGKLSDQVMETLAERALPIADTQIGNRVAFAASMMDGKGVIETHARGTAAAEIRALADETLRRLSKES